MARGGPESGVGGLYFQGRAEGGKHKGAHGEGGKHKAGLREGEGCCTSKHKGGGGKHKGGLREGGPQTRSLPITHPG